VRIFDRGGDAPYYTRPMATGLPELVDCDRLAEDATVLERVYELGSFARIADALAEPRGVVRASFAFSKTPLGRPGARVAVSAEPQLVCQRCMQDFAFPVNGSSEIEFAADDEASAADSEREPFRADGGLVSLKDLAEEELLLALPVAPACSAPQACGRAPSRAAQSERSEESAGMRRPFSALKDLLKKT
jgi:DUF177 domain-containing protein